MTKTDLFPYVSILIVNHNGLEYLSNCLMSLKNSTYPKNCFEVILVDNNSVDKSIKHVEENFPWVKLVKSSINLGFAGGNNLGLKYANGTYIALLNNDTVVHSKWLEEMIKVAESDSKIGICTSKINFFYRFLTLKINISGLENLTDNTKDSNSPILKLSQINFDGKDITEDCHYLDGFSPPTMVFGKRIRFAAKNSIIRIPVLSINKKTNLKIKAKAMTNLKNSNLSVECENQDLMNTTIAEDIDSLNIALTQNVMEKAQDIINNTGGIIFSDGAGADRGFQQLDNGQYESQEEVFAACGASMLIKEELIREIGLFDKYFFTYYEDTDFSWRARLRGWKIVYVPTSKIRHVHCGTSLEWSPSFIFYVERNRVSMLLKNAPAKLWLRELIAFYYTTIRRLLNHYRRDIFNLSSIKVPIDLRMRIKAAISLSSNIPNLTVKRIKIMRKKKIDNRFIYDWIIKK